MTHLISSAIRRPLILTLSILVCSCAGAPKPKTTTSAAVPVSAIPEAVAPKVEVPATVAPEAVAPKLVTPEPVVPEPLVPEPLAIPVVPIIPTVPVIIMGEGQVPAYYLAAFLLRANPAAEADFVRDLTALYIEEAKIEGVNHDVAFSQMCLETGYLKFGGLVTPDMFNFCGLGALGPENPGVRFPTPRLGVRAHIQHLKGYADTAPPNQAVVDPRYKWLRYGSAPAIADLAGRWAQDPSYGAKINSILQRLYDLAFGG